MAFAEAVEHRIRLGKTKVIIGRFTANASTADITPGLQTIFYGDFTNETTADPTAPKVNVTSTAGVMKVLDGCVSDDVCPYICIGE